MENEEKMNFDVLDEVGVKEDSNVLSMRPVENMAILKHDARDGSIKVILSNDDDEPDEVSAKKLEFVPTLIFTYVGGSINSKTEKIRFASALTSNNYFDVYQYNEDSNESLGIMKSTVAYDKSNGATSRLDRVFGVLRSVDGNNPMSYPEIEEHFKGEPIVPCFIDLKYSKSKWLQNKVTGNWSRAIKKKFVTISGGKKGLSYTTTAGKSYHPEFSITENEKSLAKMAEISQDYIKACLDFANEVVEHDKFIRELYVHGLTMPNAVDYLRDLDVYDVESLKRYFQEQNSNWDALYQTILSSGMAKEQSVDKAVAKVENSSIQNEDIKKAINDTYRGNNSEDEDKEIPVEEDELPF